MHQKCAMCGILMDVPCTNPACDGHRNASVGDVCVYCADNERSNRHFVRELLTLFVSSLRDCAADVESGEAYGEQGP
jgi:hypothetical protein